MGAALALTLALGCQAPGPGVGQPAADSGHDAGEFSLCAIPCGPGSVCVGFRCEARGDAGSMGGNDVPGVDAGSRPPVRPCCPLDPPTCGCVRVGGPVLSSGVCPQVCGHAFPEAWRRVVELHSNCPAWSWPLARCADAGEAADALRADVPDDAPTDTPADAPADAPEGSVAPDDAR